jgi:hypothetical protein
MTMRSHQSGSKRAGCGARDQPSHILYLPTSDDDDSFAYTIHDGYGGTAGGMITVTWSPRWPGTGDHRERGRSHGPLHGHPRLPLRPRAGPRTPCSP